MTDTFHILKSFIANTIDVYDEQTLDTFIVDSNLNIDLLLNHPLTKLNVVYNFVWNAIFGTYATKKDFSNFVVDTLSLKPPFVGTNLDHSLFDKILSHEPFMLSRFGLLSSFVQFAKAHLIANSPRLWEDRANIVNILDAKWRHRFDVSQESKHHEPSLLKSFVRYLMHDQGVSRPYKEWRHISGFQAETKPLDNDDSKYMTHVEIIQYSMYKDNRFLLQLATHHVIVQTNSSTIARDTTNNLKNALLKDLHKDTIHIIVCDTLSSVKYASNTRDKQYIMDYHTFKACPQIAKAFTLVTCIADEEHMNRQQLCLNKEGCSLVVVQDDSNIVSMPNSINYADWSVIYTTIAQLANPMHSIYFIPTHDNISSLTAQQEIIQYAWKQYMSINRCPVKTQNHRLNTMLYIHFLNLYYKKHASLMSKVFEEYKKKSNRQSLQSNSSSTCSIVLVDTRYNVLSAMACMISLYNILRHSTNKDFSWCVKIITTTNAKQDYERFFETLGMKGTMVDVQVCNQLEVPIFSLETYNALLKDTTFWQSIGTDTCIIVQDDGMLINGKNIKDYLKYDYVGAPWVDTPDNAYIKQFINPQLVGNGGFSVRNVKKMAEICEKYADERYQLFFHNINEIPEDVYFVKHLVKEGYSVAPFNVARQFSVEQVQCVNPVGFHKFWMYHSPKDSLQMFQMFQMLLED